ncbi:hypothetical protein JXA05_04220 [Candidatus Peregrinibacteria bacterium]|nr:hypothetical protein [Candidatus Peregrinibacteria bacterium]
MQQLLLQVASDVTRGIQEQYQLFVGLAPYYLGALALFLFGWILAEMAGRAVIKASTKLKLEWLSEKLGLKQFLERAKTNMTTAQLVAKSLKGYLIFLFFIQATKVARMTEVAEFLDKVISYVPQVIIAVFIMLVGIRIGNTMQIVISTSLSFAKEKTSEALGLAAKYTVLAFAVLAALAQLNIAEILVRTLFIGFVAMLALAGGLAFGLGGKDVMKELLESIREGAKIKDKK